MCPVLFLGKTNCPQVNIEGARKVGIPPEKSEERRGKWWGGYKNVTYGWRPVGRLLTVVRKGFTEGHLSRGWEYSEACGYMSKSILGAATASAKVRGTWRGYLRHMRIPQGPEVDDRGSEGQCM